jgi:aromatic-L-amino-acid/L-tryptophan decarboxylase
MPEAVRQHHTQDASIGGEDISSVFEEFKQYVLPYGSGNTHPGFMGWVQGGGAITISAGLPYS